MKGAPSAAVAEGALSLAGFDAAGARHDIPSVDVACATRQR